MPVEGSSGWDYVVNCSTEERYGQAEQVSLTRVSNCPVGQVVH
jgi:hypothetical protein